MTFIDYFKEFKKEDKDFLKEVNEKKKTLPRNFKSYVKKINSKPVVIFTEDNKSLVELCVKNDIKCHVLKGNKYLVDSSDEKVLIKNIFDENSLISINKRNGKII